jgi:Ca2+/H+ antiporter
MYCSKISANTITDWLEGVLLMASYIIIALAAWFYPNIVEDQC